MMKAKVAQSHRVRVYLLITATVCLTLLCISIAVPLVVLAVKDRNTKSDVARKERSAVEEVGQRLLAPMQNAFNVAAALKGYVLSDIRRLPSINASATDRLEGQAFPRFDSIARYMASLPHSAFAWQSLLPGGVVAFIHPSYYSKYYELDTLEFLPPPFEGDWPTPAETINDGTTSVIGPCLYESAWVVLVRTPIYNCFQSLEDDMTGDIDGHSTQIEDFWGFATVAVDLARVVKMIQLRELAGMFDMRFALYTTSSSGHYHVIESTLPSTVNSLNDHNNFIEDSTKLCNLSSLPLCVAVAVTKTTELLTPTNVCLIVFVAFIATFVVFAVASTAILYYTKEYDGRPYAPKLAPFAVLTIGPCWEKGLWDVASQELTAVSERLQRVLDKAMAAHHAYPIAQLHPYTSSYTTRSLDAAVHMAFSVLEELQRHPIDGPLRKAVGDEDGRLMVACAVHWCRDATVLMHSASGEFRYDGPDMVAASRMWPLCAPNVVTLSRAARHIAEYTVGVVVRPYSSVVAEAVVDFKDSTDGDDEGMVDVGELFMVTDPNSLELSAAERDAATHGAKNMRRRCTDCSAVTASRHGSACTQAFIGGDVGFADSEVGAESSLTLPSIAASEKGGLWSALVQQQSPAHSALVYDESVVSLMYIVQSGFGLILRPLASVERNSIVGRWTDSLDVPVKCVMKHLAARFIVDHILDLEDHRKPFNTC